MSQRGDDVFDDAFGQGRDLGSTKEEGRIMRYDKAMIPLNAQAPFTPPPLLIRRSYKAKANTPTHVSAPDQD
jgi:hypothetical protein